MKGQMRKDVQLLAKPFSKQYTQYTHTGPDLPAVLTWYIFHLSGFKKRILPIRFYDATPTTGA